MRGRIKLVALAAILIAVPALAYIPPASFLMQKMAQKRAEIGQQRLKVSMQCSLGKGEKHAETLYLKVPGLVRRERDGGIVDLCRSGRCYRLQGDAKPTPLPDWSYLPYLFFAESADSSRYERLLKSLGVNTKVDTITRCFSRLAIVLGAKNWERDRPQFWLDKDLFLPLRLMVKDGSSLVDIVWIDWGSKTAGDWFPARLSIRSDGRTTEECSVTEVKSGASLPDKLFKIPRGNQ
ncbi:MAG TPA: hypothetical protein VM425_06750 [Myxococcota bacterium]|nr:hypothetical protein [Myxococcota bacterium]